MSHARTSSEATIKTPHSVSLKVLRLSKPSLSHQIPLPPTLPSAPFKFNPSSALASHSLQPDPQFALSPLLTLPSSFGTLHVGETFTCALCVNNELSKDSGDDHTINSVRITADMQSPSSSELVPIDLSGAPDVADAAAAVALVPGETLQRIMRCYLREEGPHVLAVTVTYTETLLQQVESGTRMSTDSRLSVSTPTGTRVRSFRKLYQFAAQSLMGIRTKVRTLPASLMPGKSQQSDGKTFALEAQLENLGNNLIVLDEVEILPRPDMESKSLNAWEMPGQDKDSLTGKPTVLPGDVIQLAYILRESNFPDEDGLAKMRKEAAGLCQIFVKWRSSSEEGALTTAWLGGKRRA